MTPKAVREIVRDETEKSEPKVHRLPFEVDNTYFAGVTDSRSLVEIGQGSTSSTRIGVKARVARIYMTAQFWMHYDTVNQVRPGTVRFGIDILKDTKYEGVLDSPARGFFDKPDYVSVTKRVLLDKTLSLKTSGDGDVPGPVVNFKKMITLKNHELRWIVASAGDPESGNIVFWYKVESPSSSLVQKIHIRASFDVYFSEV